MTQSAKPSQPLTADEMAALPPPPDVETPTTSLTNLKSGSTAEVHFPGLASSAKYAAESDTLPDPVSLKEK